MNGRDSDPVRQVAYVYPNSRKQLAADVGSGLGADSSLLGQNHLAAYGFDSVIHEPALTAAGPSGGLLHRLRWNLREVLVPWEVKDADVVISALHNLLPLAARVRRRPRVIVLDFALATVWERSGLPRRRLMAASLRSAAAIVCLSDEQRERLLQRVRLNPAKVHTVHLGIDHDFFRPDGDADDGYVLAVGKDLARDYATLAEAAAGIGSDVILVTENRNVLGISFPSNLDVRRDLSYEELRHLYARARCVALPLRQAGYAYGTESGGLTALMEAMAMAKPIVVTDRPIFHEYVEADHSALFVPPEDPLALRQALRRVLSDDALASSLGQAARTRIEERHTMSIFTAGLAAIVKSVA